MISIDRRLLNTTLVLVLAAHTDARGQVTPQDPSTRTLAQLSIDVLPYLSNGAPLSTWQAANARDSIALPRASVYSSGNDNWCAQATLRLPLASGETALRTAYFYPPEPPDPIVLPRSGPAAQLRGQCRLGLISFEAVQDSNARLTSLSQQTRQLISTALGTADTVTRLTWAHAAEWRNRAYWKTDSVTLLTAIAKRCLAGECSADTAGRVIVMSSGKQSGITFEFDVAIQWAAGKPRYDEDMARRRRGQDRLEEMVALAALGGPVEGRMRRIMAWFNESTDSQQRGTDQDRSEFTGLMVQWITASRTVPLARRAAALVAADLLMSGAMPCCQIAFSDPAHEAVRRRLIAVGALFDYSPLGTAHSYTHSWLKQALQIDPGGRAGELALLTLMEIGFETSATCSEQKGHGFRAVISRGEQQLRERPGSAINTDIHTHLARAYGDIVRLADGGVYYEPNEAFAAEAPRARERAIEHYRLALSGAASTQEARQSWSELWRLMTGLSPAKNYFYCVYD
jgi:hypothetical protein